MPAEKLEQFGGMLPAWDAHLLPQGQASVASNGYLFSGALAGWRQPKLLRTLQNSAARCAFRIPIVSETQAVAYLLFVNNPQPSDTFTVGDLTYTWTVAAGGLAVPYTVLVGANPAASALNALAALTADNGTNQNAGTLYGKNTTQNGSIIQYAPNSTPLPGLPAATQGTVIIAGNVYPYVEIGSPDFGVAFNTVVVTESTGTARTTWLKDLLSLADTTTTLSGGTNATSDTTILGNSQWLEFLDQDTNVLRSQVVDDVFNRWYIASPTQPPTYNTYDRIVAGKPAWLLGVPAPGCSPGVTVTGGGNTLTLPAVAATGTGTAAGANSIFLVQIKPTGATQLQDVQVYLTADAPNANFAAVIFQDNAGVPGALLGTGEDVFGMITGANTSAFVNPPPLLDNTPYWIGVAIDSTVTFEVSNGGTFSSFTNTFSNGPPIQAPAASIGTPGLRMFADLLTSDVQESRSYLYTWESAYNEEGPASPATTVDGWSNGVWTLNPLFQPNANDVGVERNLTYLNVYRTVPGQSGSTVFFYLCTLRFVDWAFSLTGTAGPWYSGNTNLPLPSFSVNGVTVGGSLSSSTGQFVDTLPDNYVALNNQLGSTTWFPPPENLQGIVSMPNGVFAGWKNNEVWFSEPYQPHAWPPGYVITTDYPIVGLGVTIGALVVCTAAAPYVISGSQPTTMAATKCKTAAPCLSRGSILPGDRAVTFASPNGLIEVSPAGECVNTTDVWFTRDRWQQLVPQKFLRAIELAGEYFCFGSTSSLGLPADNSAAQTGFSIQLTPDAASFTIWPHPGGHRLGFMPFTSHVLINNVPQNIDNVLLDPWTGTGMVIAARSVYYYDFSDPLPVMVPYDWRSKTYQNNAKKNYSAFKLFFTVPAGTPALAPERFEAPVTDPGWAALGANQYAIVKVYADIGADANGNPDGSLVLVEAKEVRRSGEMLRVQSGFKAENWQFEIMGRVLVSNLQIATAAKELANV